MHCLKRDICIENLLIGPCILNRKVSLNLKYHSGIKQIKKNY